MTTRSKMSKRNTLSDWRGNRALTRNLQIELPDMPPGNLVASAGPANTLVSLIKDHSTESCENVLLSNCVSTLNVNFHLNKQKAINKKLDSADRSKPFSVQYADCEGKQIVIYCQAGLYELVRKAMHVYFTAHKSHKLATDITVHKEKSSGLVVQTVYKLTHKGSGAGAYTVNLYHTKSSMLINGRSMPTFLDADWPGICKIIRDAGATHHSVINENLKKGLRELSATILDKSTSSKPRKLTDSNMQNAENSHSSVHSPKPDKLTNETQKGNHDEYAGSRMEYATQMQTPLVLPTPPGMPPSTVPHTDWTRNTLIATSLPSVLEDSGTLSVAEDITRQTSEPVGMRMSKALREIIEKETVFPITLPSDPSLAPTPSLGTCLPTRAPLSGLQGPGPEHLPPTAPLEMRHQVLIPIQQLPHSLGVPATPSTWQEADQHQAMTPA